MLNTLRTLREFVVTIGYLSDLLYLMVKSICQSVGMFAPVQYCEYLVEWVYLPAGALATPPTEPGRQRLGKKMVEL